jgi:hypothetical protein
MDGFSLLAKRRGNADVATPLGNSEKNALQQEVSGDRSMPFGL